MFERILHQFQERVRHRQYVMTLHAEEEMNDDELTIFDVEHAILTGTIVERQRDRTTAEWKYLVEGDGIQNVRVIVVAKSSPTGKMVILTVYVE